MNKIALWQQIKDDIRQDNLPVDQLLTQQWLSEYYQVSRIPVRDAIVRLLADGWFIAHGKKGVKIPPLNANLAQELYLMRLPLETLALELAFEHLTFAVLGQAEDVLAKLSSEQGLSAIEHGILNWQFHYYLYQPSGRSTLLRTLTQLHEQCERYIGFQAHSLDYHQRSQDEHYQLLTALREKDLAKAKDVLHRHINEAGQAMVAYLGA